MKNWKKAVCLLLSVVIIFAYSEPAQALTNDSIRQKEAEIQAAKEQISGLKSSKTDIEKLKKELEQSRNDLTVYVTQLDEQLSGIQAKIEQYNTMITEKEEEIEIAAAELEEAIRQQEEQYEAMKKRIKFMYEKGDTFYLELLLSSGGFADMTNKADYIESLSRYDRDKLQEYIETKELVQLCKEELETEKEVLAEAKAAVEEEEASISALIAQKEQQIKEVTSDISLKEASLREYEALIAQEQAEIAALEKAVAEEKARLEAENAKARVYNGGMFTWPCPGYTRISDEYGNRIDPILGTQKFHSGLDLAASAGTAILAAYEGDVVAAAYSSSMGNYIMIDHGSGLYTVYMHCSALYVSKGQTVAKGQKIAAVGSTGRSTGSHLHFSVRQSGSYVNPWNYLK